MWKRVRTKGSKYNTWESVSYEPFHDTRKVKSNPGAAIESLKKFYRSRERIVQSGSKLTPSIATLDAEVAPWKLRRSIAKGTCANRKEDTPLSV